MIAPDESAEEEGLNLVPCVMVVRNDGTSPYVEVPVPEQPPVGAIVLDVLDDGSAVVLLLFEPDRSTKV